MPETRNQTETESESKSVSPQKHPGGRPTKYDETLVREICARIAHGEPLVKICKDDHMPNVSSIYLWLSRYPEFSEMYTKAREDQADTLADEIQEIADQMPMEKTDGNGNTSFDGAYIQWMKLRVDARKWTASKLKPRKYGERVSLAGDADNPLKVEASLEAKGLFNDLLAAMEAKKQAE